MKNAIISAILTNPATCQEAFNAAVSARQGIIIGRMGLPIAEEGVALIAIAVKAAPVDIAAFVGEINAIAGVTANSVTA